jgi:hypothetical protein
LARAPRTYQLSSSIVASSVGAGVLCLAPEAMGRTFRLYAHRPDARLNRTIPRADLPSGAAHVVAPVAPALVRVDISGPLEQRAGYHDPCAGWSDGHDAIAERLIEAFASGDVLLVGDTPGGAAAGTTTSPVAVTLSGGASQTFTYVFTESGTGAGSLTFSGTTTGIRTSDRAIRTAAASWRSYFF